MKMSLSPTRVGRFDVYEIKPEFGERRNGNLFHSFERFNPRRLGTITDEARFTGPNDVTNIIVRVTGGESVVDGLISSMIPGANLYLLNPAGVTFMANARLSISGSFHVSTAQKLAMTDEAVFHTDPGKSSILTSASPAAFGFTTNPAGIKVLGGLLRVQPQKTLSIFAGDVTLDGTGARPSSGLEASSGTIQIASLASTGYLTPSGDDLDVTLFDTLGVVRISNHGNLFANTDSPTKGGGTIRIRSGRLLIDDSTVIAATLGDADGAPVGIDVQARQDVAIENSSSLSTTTQKGIGEAGDIRIFARSLQVDNSTIFSSSAAPGEGNGGNIYIEVGRLAVTNGGSIVSGSFGRGTSGSITILAKDAVSVSGTDSRIESSTQSPTEGAGAISITSSFLAVDRGAAVAAETVGAGPGGILDITVKDLWLAGAGRIATSSAPELDLEPELRPGPAGSISINAAHSVRISGNHTGLFSDATAGGLGGDVTVRTGRLGLFDRSVIAATSSGDGDAGNISIAALDSLESFDSRITTEATSADGGNITVAARDLLHLVRSQMTATVRGGAGQGGNIIIDPHFVILNDSEITANAFGGPGGNVRITADVYLTSQSLVTASSARGVPGTVDVQASVTEVGSELTSLPESVLPAAALLRAPCPVRFAGGAASSLAVGRQMGIPKQPGILLPPPPLSYSESPQGPGTGGLQATSTYLSAHGPLSPGEKEDARCAR
jgi:filamentous hemagglutinin family protein